VSCKADDGPDVNAPIDDQKKNATDVGLDAHVGGFVSARTGAVHHSTEHQEASDKT
jgi:hypothetical protein